MMKPSHATFWLRLHVVTYGIIFAIMLFVAFCQPSYAHYTGDQVVLESVYDGDTFKVMIEVYPDLFKRISIRLDGIDTPEAGWRAKCDSELVAGDKATLWLREKLSGAIIELDGLKHGKFARRMLAKVYVEGEYVNQMIVDVGHGRLYLGDKRGSWCS